VTCSSCSAPNSAYAIRLIPIFPSIVEREYLLVITAKCLYIPLLYITVKCDIDMFCRRLGADSGLIGAFWRTESGELRPRRTGDNGQWSGVRYKTDFHRRRIVFTYLNHCYRMYVSTMSPGQIAPGVDAKPSTRVNCKIYSFLLLRRI